MNVLSLMHKADRLKDLIDFGRLEEASDLAYEILQELKAQVPAAPTQVTQNNLFALFANVSNKKDRFSQYPKITVPTELNARGKLIIYQSKDKILKFVDSGMYPNNEYYGRMIEGKGIEFARTTSDGMRFLIESISLNPMATLTIKGQRHSFCCFCSTEITSKNSLAVGYGPICASKWGLPWEGMGDKETLNEDM